VAQLDALNDPSFIPPKLHCLIAATHYHMDPHYSHHFIPVVLHSTVAPLSIIICTPCMLSCIRKLPMRLNGLELIASVAHGAVWWRGGLEASKASAKQTPTCIPHAQLEAIGMP
jgi:hypothetical protein